MASIKALRDAALDEREKLLRQRQFIDAEIEKVENFLEMFDQMEAKASEAAHPPFSNSPAQLLYKFERLVDVPQPSYGTMRLKGLDGPVSRDGRSPPDEVIEAAKRALAEAQEPLRVTTLVDILAHEGLVLGETDVERQRRVTTILSRTKEIFVPIRGTGWALAVWAKRIAGVKG